MEYSETVYHSMSLLLLQIDTSWSCDAVHCDFLRNFATSPPQHPPPKKTRRRTLADNELCVHQFHNTKCHFFKKKKKERLLLHSYDSTLNAHRKFYVDLRFLCLSFIRNLRPGVIAYPWGLLPGKPFNKCFPSCFQRLFVTRRSNYHYCCITTCSTKICPIFIFLAFCSYLPQREFCDADVLLQPHKHVLGDPALRTVSHRSNLY